jgi:DNA-binding Lrp family transcriptional regulator
VNVETGSEDRVLKKLREMEAAEESYVSYGVYDLITKIKADTMENLKEEISKIRAIDNVKSTLTLIMT